jgi:hypothetical protein
VLFIFFSLFVYKIYKSDYQLFSKNSFVYYDVYSKESKIILIKNYENKEERDTTILEKKGKQYFQSFFDVKSNKLEYMLMLSTKNDTFYKYGNISDFYSKINKISENNYKATFGNNDTIKYKYRFSYYYDRNYKIKRIEFVLHDKIENYYAE